MTSAVAVRGAVIVSQDGTRCNYKNKCDSCGNVEAGTSGLSIPGGGVTTSSFVVVPSAGLTIS